jgi:hypothetical protein
LGDNNGTGVSPVRTTVNRIRQAEELAVSVPLCEPAIMSNKEIVIDLVGRLPEDATLLEIAKEIEFVAGVREGFAQLDRGEGVPLEEVAKQLPSGISK